MPFSTPVPPGSSPLAMLSSYHACLRELLSHLGDLLAEGCRKPGERESVARDILVGFDCALHVHLADEEDDVFPAILAAAESPGRRAQAFELVSSLLVEHRELAELWSGLRVALGAIGHGLVAPFPEYTARRFLALCHRHLEREERELGDLVRCIPADRLARVTESIARRHAGQPDCSPPRCGKN